MRDRGTSFRFVQNGRLVWYTQKANPDFWDRYWQREMTPAAFALAEKRCTEDRLGRVLHWVLPKNKVHLEAGAGPGFWVAALQATGRWVIGVEYAPAVVAKAKALRPGLPLVVGDVTQLPFQARSFASVLSFGVVEHDPQGPGRFLAEFARVLLPGGLLVVSVPAFGVLRRLKMALASKHRGAHPGLEFYQYGFSVPDMTRELNLLGFCVERKMYYGAHRLWQEEVPLYRDLCQKRGGRLWKRLIQVLVEPWDGHMVVLFARKGS